MDIHYIKYILQCIIDVRFYKTKRKLGFLYNYRLYWKYYYNNKFQNCTISSFYFKVSLCVLLFK